LEGEELPLSIGQPAQLVAQLVAVLVRDRPLERAGVYREFVRKTGLSRLLLLLRHLKTQDPSGDPATNPVVAPLATGQIGFY
jgi:hypothetical protein